MKPPEYGCKRITLTINPTAMTKRFKIIRRAIEPSALRRWRHKNRNKENVQTGYNSDGLSTNHDHSFVEDSRFQAAYARAVKSAGVDYKFEWRVHTALWAASHAVKLSGDFAECGVNRGAVSSAVMQYLDWNRTGKTFFFLDTFEGLPADQENDEEAALKRVDTFRDFYEDDYLHIAQKNFADWPKTVFIKGKIPETLSDERLSDRQFAYVHIDMNLAFPEVAALKYFWPRMVKGGVILFDDFAYYGYGPQNQALQNTASELGCQILHVPTGQGLLIKS